MAALPYGAMPDDTGEYMLGDVHVTVVLMESDQSLPGADRGIIQYGGQPTVNYTEENWTEGGIADAKANVQTGLDWWEETLNALPGVRDGLLNFTYDYTYADNPVHTPYEPIARISDNFSLWIYDFLRPALTQIPGYTRTNNFSSDIRAWNNFKRQETGADWAFTIFVVNNFQDEDKEFTQFEGLGAFSKAFSFAGGRLMVVPASRPASTYAHEAGHMFWAYDEYAAASSDYTARRGYYDTQNTNHASNPAFRPPNPTATQQNSIMANDVKLTNAYANHTTSQSSMEMIGWKDSDADGLFDVLDVPFQLSGSGRYDTTGSSPIYRFTGSTSVRTLPNRNSSGLANDITINQISRIEVAIDNGPWTTVQILPPRTYQTSLELAIPAAAGQTIKIRSADARTGAMSPEFTGTTGAPHAPLGISGFVFLDANGNGVWDTGETPIRDFGVEVLDQDNNPVDLQRYIEPNDHSPDGTPLSQIAPGVILTAVGSDATQAVVITKTSSISAAGQVFGNYSNSFGEDVATWNSVRQLRIDFASPVGSVMIRAFRGNINSLPSFARIEAYGAGGVLLERITSGPITGNSFINLALSRPTGDIKYVIVGGHAQTEVMLDTLVWGPGAFTTSNPAGAYSLTGLPPGTYNVTVTPPALHTITTPSSGQYTVTIASVGESLGNRNFGIRVQSNIWHNLVLATDVSEDDVVAPIDALMVINYLNANTGNSLPLDQNGDPTGIGLIDTNNDGYCTPIDALLVFNALNGGGGEGEQNGGSGGGGGGSGGGGGAGESEPEGEELSFTSQGISDYYAANPLHFENIPGDDLPCCCERCVEQRDAPLPVALSADESGLGLAGLTSSDDASRRKPASTPVALPAARLTQVASRLRRLTTLLPLARKAATVDLAATAASAEEVLDLIAADVSDRGAQNPGRLLRRD